MFAQFGTPTSTAAQSYLNKAGIPQLFTATGSPRFNDPERAPWSSAMLPNYVMDGRIFGKYIQDDIKDAKVAILFQNDDFGKGYVLGLKETLGPNVQVVGEASYEPTDPTLTSQIAQLAASGANVLVNISAGRAAAQSIRAVHEIGWKPIQLLDGPWATVNAVFKPVGLEVAAGIITTQYLKAADDPRWANDPDVTDYINFMKKYRSNADYSDRQNLEGYLYAQLLVYVIKAAGDDLTRANIMKVSTSMKDVKFGVLKPGITASTSPINRNFIQVEQLVRFDGERFIPIGEVISSD